MLIASALSNVVFRSVDKIDEQNEAAVKVAQRQWKMRAYGVLLAFDFVYVASISLLEYNIENNF